MIWAKTEAGRSEVQARSLVKERALRTLLLLIDGSKTQDMLMAQVAGITPGHFDQLARLGLIAAAAHAPAAAAKPVAPTAPALDTATLARALTQLIAKELGLRGFTLTLALEKAVTLDELRDVAERTLDQIRERKGLLAAEHARRTLFGP